MVCGHTVPAGMGFSDFEIAKSVLQVLGQFWLTKAVVRTSVNPLLLGIPSRLLGPSGSLPDLSFLGAGAGQGVDLLSSRNPRALRLS